MPVVIRQPQPRVNPTATQLAQLAVDACREDVQACRGDPLAVLFARRKLQQAEGKLRDARAQAAWLASRPVWPQG